MYKPKSKTTKYSILFIIIALSLTLTFSGCLDTEPSNDNIDEDKIQAIVTIPPEEEIVKEVGGENVKVEVLIPAGESPHSYDLEPSQLKKISEADVYFKVGSGVSFELSNMDKIKSQNKDLKIVDLSEGINVKSWSEHYGKESQNLTENKGTDGHIWLSPLNGIKMAENVYKGLKEIDSDNDNYYKQNLDNYTEKLQNLHKDIKEQLKPYKNQSFLVYHPSFGYFGDEYNLIQIGIEEGGKKPGGKGISNIVEQAKRLDIKVIFVSPQFDSSSAEVIAEEINGTVVTANPLGKNYSKNLRELGEKLKKGFKE